MISSFKNDKFYIKTSIQVIPMKVKCRNKFYSEEKCKILGYLTFDLKFVVHSVDEKIDNLIRGRLGMMENRISILFVSNFFFTFIFLYMKSRWWMNGVCRKCAFHLKPPESSYTSHDMSFSLGMDSELGTFFGITPSNNGGSYEYIVLFKSKDNSQQVNTCTLMYKLKNLERISIACEKWMLQKLKWFTMIE